MRPASRCRSRRCRGVRWSISPPARRACSAPPRPSLGLLDTPDAMMALLERAGFEVIVPDHLNGQCCGQPFLSKGFPEEAARVGAKLHERAAQGRAGGHPRHHRRLDLRQASARRRRGGARQRRIPRPRGPASPHHHQPGADGRGPSQLLGPAPARTARHRGHRQRRGDGRSTSSARSSAAATPATRACSSPSSTPTPRAS